MDLETAKKQVEEHINKSWISKGHDATHGPLIVVKHIEKPYGWVFFYTAKKHWETRDMEYAIAGNGPIIFDLRTEILHQLGTATRPEQQIKEWESQNWKP